MWYNADGEKKGAADQVYKEYCNPGFLRDRSGICLLLFPHVSYVEAAVFTYGMARGSVNFDLEKEVDHLFYKQNAPSPESYKYRVTRNYINRTDTFLHTD